MGRSANFIGQPLEWCRSEWSLYNGFRYHHKIEWEGALGPIRYSEVVI